jgi:hypothetical protein
MSATITWGGHEFHVLLKDAAWSDVGGIYIFTGVNAQNQWYPLYIGQAVSLAERLPTHERWQEAVKLGATHVHAAAIPLAADRDRIEKALIGQFQPRLNDHHK